MGTRILPTEITKDLALILGTPNFRCGPLAEILRRGGQVIEHKAEAEQAAVLWWLLGHYFAHGEGWQKAAMAELGIWVSEPAENAGTRDREMYRIRP